MGSPLFERFTPRLLLTLIVLMLIVLALGGWLDHFGMRGYENAWAKALAAFGVSKTLNAALSVIQESQVEASMIFASGTIAIGQLVSPLNSVVEALSQVLLASLVSLFIQKLLLGVGQWWGVQMLLLVVGGLFLAGMWNAKFRRSTWQRVLLRLLTAMLLLRFCIPITAAVNDLTSTALLEGVYSESLRESQRLGEAANIESDLNSAEGETLTAKKLAGFWTRMHGMMRVLDDLLEHAVRLITVFVLQTLVFPLLFLVALFLLTRHGIRALLASP